MPFTVQSSYAHRPAPTPWRRASALALAVLFLSGLLEGGVINTKHDLSDASGGPYNTQVCAFCHTPHSANRILNAPLWNRFVDRTKVFIPYQSATMNTVPGDPNNSLGSLLCLGCHDGTLGTVVVNLYAGSDKHDLVNAPGPGGIPDTTSSPNCQRCHPEIYGGQPVQWTGTDLGNDHPVAMLYPTPSQDPQFNPPPDPQSGWPDLPLWGGRVECATCHNPHDPTNQPFLRKPNPGSALCLTCHIK